MEVGALSHRLVCMNAASHWLLDSKCDDVHTQQMPLKRGPAPDSTQATPPAKRRRATESDFQGTVTTDPVSTNTAVNQTVTKEAVLKDAEQHTADEKEAESSHSQNNGMFVLHCFLVCLLLLI